MRRKKQSLSLRNIFAAAVIGVLSPSQGGTNQALDNASLLLNPPLEGYLSCSILTPLTNPNAACLTPQGQIESSPEITQRAIESYIRQFLLEEMIRLNRLRGAREFDI